MIILKVYPIFKVNKKKFIGIPGIRLKTWDKDYEFSFDVNSPDEWAKMLISKGFLAKSRKFDKEHPDSIGLAYSVTNWGGRTKLLSYFPGFDSVHKKKYKVTQYGLLEGYVDNK